MLTREQVSRYETQGFLCPIQVLQEAEVARFRAAVAEIELLKGGALKRFGKVHHFFRWGYDLATHSAILDAVGNILGDDILIGGTLIFCKQPRDPAFVSWHQDAVYSKWHLTPSVSAWVALTSSNSLNGCMRVIPGSHQHGLVAHQEMPSDANLLRRGETVQCQFDEDQAADLVLNPGEMSLHDCKIIHGSNPNRSDAKRMGFIIRYVTPKHRDIDLPLIRARGCADCSHLILVNPPEECSQEEALFAWEKANPGERVVAKS